MSPLFSTCILFQRFGYRSRLTRKILFLVIILLCISWSSKPLNIENHGDIHKSQKKRTDKRGGKYSTLSSTSYGGGIRGFGGRWREVVELPGRCAYLSYYLIGECGIMDMKENSADSHFFSRSAVMLVYIGRRSARSGWEDSVGERCQGR